MLFLIYCLLFVVAYLFRCLFKNDTKFWKLHIILGVEVISSFVVLQPLVFLERNEIVRYAVNVKLNFCVENRSTYYQFTRER